MIVISRWKENGEGSYSFFDWANYMLVIVIGKYLSFCLLVLSGDLFLFRFLFERSFLLEITFFYSYFCLLSPTHLSLRVSSLPLIQLCAYSRVKYCHVFPLWFFRLVRINLSPPPFLVSMRSTHTKY